MTFREMVFARCPKQVILPAIETTDLMQMLPEQIQRYPVALGHFDYGIVPLMSGRRKFTILRDPVNRYISTVSHMMRDRNFSDLHQLLSGLSLEEALLHEAVRIELQDNMVKLFCYDAIPTGIDAEEAATLQRARSASVQADLDMALARLDHFDVVGTQERYHDSVQLMFASSDLPPVKLVPVVNDDPQSASSKVSDHIRGQIKEMLAKDQALYEYASTRTSRDVSQTIYSLSAATFIRRQQAVGDAFKFHLSQLPNAYGWYAPETGSNGQVQLWGGSRDEQGVVLRVAPFTKYLVVAGLHAIDERQMPPQVKSNVSVERVWVASVREWNYVCIALDNDGDNELLDLAFVYENAVSPAAKGTGNDIRRLGLLLTDLAVFKVENFPNAAEEFVMAMQKSPPGPIAGPSGVPI
jgi:hypothetical protein